MAQIAGSGQALRDRKAGAGMPAVEHVVLGLDPPREPAEPAQLPQRSEPAVSPGQELVGVGLMARVPDDLVARRLEDAMQRDRHLDHAQR